MKRTGWIAVAVVFVVLLVILGAAGLNVLLGPSSDEPAASGQAAV